jgi:hypothetical protein
MYEVAAAAPRPTDSIPKLRAGEIETKERPNAFVVAPACLLLLKGNRLTCQSDFDYVGYGAFRTDIE